MPRLSGMDKGRRRKRKRTSTPEQNKCIKADDGMAFEDFTDLAELSPRSSTSSTVTPLVKHKNTSSLEEQPSNPSFGSTRGVPSHHTITSIMKKNHLPQVSTAKRSRLDHAASDSTRNQSGSKSVHFDTAITENKLEARPNKRPLTKEKQILSCTKRSLEELMAYIQPKYPDKNVSTLICNKEQSQGTNMSLYEFSEKLFEKFDHSLKQEVVAEVMFAILELFQVHPGWILSHTSQEVNQISAAAFLHQIRINISSNEKGIDCHYCPDSYFVQVHENEISMLFGEILALLLLGIELDDDNINASSKYLLLKQSISCNRALGQQTFWGNVLTAVEHGDLDKAVKLLREFTNGKESWKNNFCASREEAKVDDKSQVSSNQKLLPQPKSLFENIDLDDNRRSIIESELKMAREKVAYYESLLDSSAKEFTSTVQPKGTKVSEIVQNKETAQTVTSENGSTNDKEEKTKSQSNEITNACVQSGEVNATEVVQGEDRNVEFGNSLKPFEPQKSAQSASSDRQRADKIVGEENDKFHYQKNTSGESVYPEGSTVCETIHMDNIVDSIPPGEIDKTIQIDEKMDGDDTSKKNSNRKNTSSGGGIILHTATSNEVDNSNTIDKDMKVSFSIPKKKEFVNVDGKMTNTLTEIKEEPIMTSIIEPDVEQIDSNITMGEVSVNPSYPYGHSRNPVREMRIGSRIDVLDKYGVWSSATVVERKKKQVKIQYDGWHSKWNDKLDLNSKRLAPIYTHSARIKCLAALHFMGKKNSVKRKEYLLWRTSTLTSNDVDSESTENKIYNPSDLWPCILHIRMPSAKKKSTKILSKEKNVFVEPYMPSLLPNYFQKLMEFGGFWIEAKSVQLFPYSPTQHTSFVEDHAESNFRANFKKAFVAAIDDKTTPGYLKTQNLYKKGSLVNYRYQSSMERLVDFSGWHDEDAFRNENNDTSVKKKVEK